MHSDQMFSGVIPTCTECNATVKPDIVFFGEQLPERFFRCVGSDLQRCDLLIIMGTSLTVQPFASLVDRYYYHIISDLVMFITKLL